MVRTSLWSGPVCCRAGPRGTRPHPARLALASLRAVCGMPRSRGPSLARPWALRAPGSGFARAAAAASRPRCAGQPVARLAALPVGRGAARRSGPGGPPPPSLRLSAARAPARLAPGVAAPLLCCAVACVWWPRLAWLRACCPPCRRRPGGRLPPRRACFPRSSRRGARRLRGGCSPPLFGFAAAARPARLGSAAAGNDYAGMLACGILLCYDYDGSTTVR